MGIEWNQRQTIRWESFHLPCGSRQDKILNVDGGCESGLKYQGTDVGSGFRL